MCGITMILSKERVPARFIKQMSDEIRHRGPDDVRYLCGDLNENEYAFAWDEDSSLKNGKNVLELGAEYHLLMGHRRLSILDTSSNGVQPMQALNKYLIIFNGEIFNYLELKNELIKAGYTFKSNTDTEVIMAAFDFWGEDCVNRFNGMWSFILFNKENRQFFVSRDRFGIKPLYYFQDKEKLIFASEIKAILKYPGFSRSVEYKFINNILKGKVQEHLAHTSFQNIFKFPYGQNLSFNFENFSEKLNFEKYWALVPNHSNKAFSDFKMEEYKEEYLRLLKSSVELRLRSDVQIGSALSGGLDSSSIVLLIQELLEEKGNKNDIQKTFSNVYDSKETRSCDESDFINKVTEQLKVENYQIIPEDDKILETHRKIIYHMENPIKGSIISAWYTYKLVRSKGVIVTLDGQGADEQLGGYLPYIRNHLLYSNEDNKVYQEVYQNADFYKKRKFLSSLVSVLPHDILLKYGLRQKVTYNYLLPLNSQLNYNVQSSLVGLFQNADRISMAHSVESRLPFMDYRLVKFLNDVPACYKIQHGWTKYMSRKAFEGKLNDDIVWRKDKLGWANPESFWFGKLYNEEVSKKIEESDLLKDVLGNKRLKSGTIAEKMLKYNVAIWEDIFL